MSWWFTESIAKTPDGKTLLASFESDDTSIFPNVTQYKVDPTTHLPTGEIDYTIARGSILYCLSNSKTYKMNSQGQWVEQKSGQEIEISADDIVYDNTSSGMTATNVQDAIDEIHTLDDTQDNALTELYGMDENQQLEINYAINTGAKNLLAYNGYGTGYENGVTYTINSDGTITVNGTPQGSSPSYIELKLNGYAANVARFCDGQHILSGCPAGGGDNKYRMYAARGTYSRFDYGDGVLLTETAQTDVRLVIYIANGYTANNLVFKPMIRLAEITDSTYVPYAPTNRELYETDQRQELRYEDSNIIRLNQLTWSQTSAGTGMWIADCYTAQSVDKIVSVLITSFGALKPSEITTLFTYIPSSVSGMHTVRLVCDRNLTGISSNPTLYLRVFGYGYQTASTRMQSLNSPMTLNLNRNDLNESLDSNFDLIDSIPEEEEGE